MIEVIIFDLGGVILDFDHYAICRRLSQICKYGEYEVYDSIITSGLEKLYNEGRITSLEFFDILSKRLELKITFHDFRLIWVDIFSLNPMIPNLLLDLKRNYRIFLLSNTNEMHFEWIKDRYEILNLIDEYILSYKVGFTKPDKRIFYEAITRGGVSPDRYIYIDDVKDYVDAAKEIGLIGIHFQSVERLEEELVKYGVITKQESRLKSRPQTLDHRL